LTTSARHGTTPAVTATAKRTCALSDANRASNPESPGRAKHTVCSDPSSTRRPSVLHRPVSAVGGRRGGQRESRPEELQRCVALFPPCPCPGTLLDANVRPNVVCCIYHRPKAVGESSDESSSDSSDSDSDSDSQPDGARPANGKGKDCGHGHGHNHDHGRGRKSKKGKDKRAPSPNAYEKVPKPRPKDQSGETKQA
jgi:hypothetical protein